MKWNDFLKILHIRALEETDVEGRMLHAETRRAASRVAIGQADSAKFLQRRTSYLESETKLRFPIAFALPGWMKWSGWGIALLTGCWLAALGQEREINLLALPLIAILVWNAVIMLLSLFHGLRHSQANAVPHWMEKILTRVMGNQSAKDNQQVTLRFRELAWPVMLRRMSFRLRAWLHIGAALLALGSAVGMYARGWSREYRAVWESTLLDKNSARLFFNALFTPASRMTRIAIPLDNLPAMQRRAGASSAKPGEASPWIHLYAATLGLFVILPRILLAGLEQNRAGRVLKPTLDSADWNEYVANLRASVEGNGSPACVMVHGLVIDDAARDRWRRLAYSKWRDVGPVECQSIALGGEAEFIVAWEPEASRRMLVFNLSVTPEAEVQRMLVEGLLTKITGQLLLALDDTEMKKRSSGFSDAAQRLTARADLWKRVMEGLTVTWI